MKEAIKKEYFNLDTFEIKNISNYSLVTESLYNAGALRFKVLINKKYTCVLFIKFILIDSVINNGINYIIKEVSLEDSEINLHGDFSNSQAKFGHINYTELNGFSFDFILNGRNKNLIESLHYDFEEKELNNLSEENKKETKMKNNIIKYFEYSHLPERLQEVSKSICEVAKEMNDSLPEGAEKQAGMRKLLEAKDCFVRASLDN
jgi:hypothetical protein